MEDKEIRKEKEKEINIRSSGIIKYENIKKTVEQMEKCVCNVNSQSYMYTGFFCKIPFPNDYFKTFPVLITSNFFHGDKILLEKIGINIRGKETKLIDLKKRIQYSSEKYMIAIIEIKEEDDINDYLEIDELMLKDLKNFKGFEYIKSEIHIIQYLGKKGLSISYSLLDNINEQKNYEFYHRCETGSGSGGSPIMNNYNKIIGIHVGMFKNKNKRLKFGTFLNFPINEFIENYYKKDVNKFIDDNLIDEFDRKKFINIKNTNVDILDSSGSFMKNNELKELSKNEFINLKILNLNNKKLSDIKELEKVKLEKLQKLNLNNNKLLDIIPLENIYFNELKKLELYGNKISDIKPLEKAKLYKLEYLNLGGNKINDINILQKVDFKELKYLNLFDNEISDIKVLEYVRFENLLLLNLGANKISDIDILQKVNFKQLNALYLQLNKIKCIEVFDKVKFDKLEILNLFENEINETENRQLISKLKSKIKFFEINYENSPHTLPMYVGMIFDVSKDILEKLIKFDNTKNFFEIFCSNFNGEILALINGNKDRPYYDINNIILSTTNYLSFENAIFEGTPINKQSKENIFDEQCLLEIFDILESNENMSDFINSKKLLDNLVKLKDLISNNYNEYLPNFFEHFDKLISKPSSIVLLLQKILEKYKNNYLPNKYIIIISDGNSSQNTEEINHLINEAKENNIIIVTYIISDKDNINKKVIYNEFPVHLKPNLKNLFNISSKVNYKNPFARYYIREKDYNFPDNGEGTLFFLLDNKETDDSNNNLSNNLNGISYEGIDIRIGDVNFDNFIKYKYQFFTKNQFFGTCWSNACAALVFLTNKRILGKKLETFETYREQLIRYASSLNSDGGIIDNQNVLNYFKKNKLHCLERNEQEARKAIMKGRFIYYSFYLRDKQWDNFSHFLEKGKGILTENILNNGLSNDTSLITGHGVLLIEIGNNYLRFLNSWGSNWGDAGTFRVEKGDILKPINANKKPKFYDLFFYLDDLTQDEKLFYNENINYIRWLISQFGEMRIERIKNKMNELYNKSFYCSRCLRNRTKDKYKIYLENGIYKKMCSFCKNSEIVKGNLKELVVLECLMNDGNEDFDINFRENYNIDIRRIQLHKNLEFKIENDSDSCSIGSENPLEKTIDPFFINMVTSIICMQNGKFIACGSNMIQVFEYESETINNLIMRNILNEDFLTLCDLEFTDKNLFASGGEDLKIYQINYQKLDLNLRFRFKNNTKINKIIIFSSINQEIIKRIAVCDMNRYIGIYNIKNENNTNNIQISLAFNIKPKLEIHPFATDQLRQKEEKKYEFFLKQNSELNFILCILYLETEALLVTSSQKNLIFWSLSENNLNIFKNYVDISTMKCSDNLLDINENLLVGAIDGICVFHHVNRNISFSFYYKNEEFGGVFSMKSLNNNYFICGRSYGFCSLFLLRKNHIRKINIFRNNNKSIYEQHTNIENDKYFINEICIRRVDDKNGYIIVSSNDKTLKIYSYKNKDNVFID